MRSGSVIKGNALFEKYIRKNFLAYIIVLAVYVFGFFVGISIFNKNISSEENAYDISSYVNDRITIIDNSPSQAIGGYAKQDFFELLILCILSFSIIGIPLIVVFNFINAVSLGITISSLVFSTGPGYGMSFSILVYMVPLIIKLFMIFALIYSSLKFLENIFKYRKEFRYEIIRHSVVILLSFIATSFIVLYRTLSMNIISNIL